MLTTNSEKPNAPTVNATQSAAATFISVIYNTYDD